ADLRDANLRYSHLIKADLNNSNLSGADLNNADLRDAKNKEKAEIPIFCKWRVAFAGEKIKIGCKEKTIAEWDEWFAGSEKYITERNIEDFKRIEAMYRAYKAYYEHLNS